MAIRCQRIFSIANLILFTQALHLSSCGGIVGNPSNLLAGESAPNGIYVGNKLYTVNLKSDVRGKFLSVDENNGRRLTVGSDNSSLFETFQIIDRNGSDLESGDPVFIQSPSGYLLQAMNGGGDSLNMSSTNTEDWESFRIFRVHGPGRIQSGDVIGLQTTGGQWVGLVDPGSDEVQARGAALQSYETFSITFPDSNPWNLAWLDEFNGSSLDTSRWNYEIQRPGWVNNEWQNYTNRWENVRVENGQLVIEARRDWYQGHEYSSGRVKTQGKASWTYGRIEARIQVPAGWGTWPAFWMMPDNQSRGWPACGEIDIMEHVGFDPDIVHATTHSEAYNWKRSEQRTAVTVTPYATGSFHVYAIQWYPDRIEAFVDGNRYFTSWNENRGDDYWPFDKNFHIILNLAVGGDWGGAKGVDPNIWPRKMLVDWVRVYQR